MSIFRKLLSKNNSLIISFSILFVISILFNFDKGMYFQQVSKSHLYNAEPQTVSSSPLRVIASNEYENLGIENLESFSNELIEITYMTDIDAIQEINKNKDAYDALLISNSMWTYMLKDTYLTDSKSLAISPVVFAVKMDKAEELGLIEKEIETQDIIEFLKQGSITLAMPSPVRTNVGATAYLSILEALSGNPEFLKPEDLDNKQLKQNVHSIFKNVERNSGSEEYLFNLIETEQCDTIVASEASIIRYNQDIKTNPNSNKTPLYILYPKDGVGINDTMLTFFGSSDKKEQYLKFRNDLVENQEKIFMKAGYRTWYGGTTTDSYYSSGFDKDFGTDISRVLKITNFPSKSVMDKAFELYIDTFRKTSAIVFVLDYSGSMMGEGYRQLNEALNLILHQEKSSQELLQFSQDDNIGVIFFNGRGIQSELFISGNEVDSLYDDKLAYVQVGGNTPLYESLTEAYQMFSPENLEGDYNKSIILMTDGNPTGQSFQDFKKKYDTYDEFLKDIPVYTIAFGNASLPELAEVAKLTNGKDFDGRENLVASFKEIRGYN